MISASDLLFIQQINNKTFDQLSVYDYWLQNHEEPNDARLHRLLDHEYLYESNDITLRLSQFTIPTLKKLLKAHHLKVSGNKNELLQRLGEHETSLSLENLTIKPVYTANHDILPLIKYTTFLVYLSMNGPLSIEEGYAFYLKHQAMSNEDLIINLYKEKIAQSKNTYLIIKCHLFLSDYYKKLNDQRESLRHLNHFAMSLVLNAINRYLENDIYLDSFFNIDHYTLDKYRNLLLMKQYSINELYEYTLSDLEGDSHHHTLAAQYIIRSIIDSPLAETKLLEELNK